jgi:PAS domain S-box-containing protein
MCSRRIWPPAFRLNDSCRSTCVIFRWLQGHQRPPARRLTCRKPPDSRHSKVGELPALRLKADKAVGLLASIVDSSEDAIISKTLEGVITSWNAGAERLFGYTAKEAIGKNISMIIPVDRHDEETSILGRLRQGEKIEHFDTIRLRKDGATLQSRCQFLRFGMPQGKSSAPRKSHAMFRGVRKLSAICRRAKAVFACWLMRSIRKCNFELKSYGDETLRYSSNQISFKTFQED